MNVSQLIEVLKCLPPEAEVKYFWDNAARNSVECAWVAFAGYVIISEEKPDSNGSDLLDKDDLSSSPVLEWDYTYGKVLMR